MKNLLTIRDLKTSFFLDEGTVKAVDGVDLDVPRGTTLGLVGESGCGKSVTAFSILRIITPPGRVVSGQILLDKNGHPIDMANLPPNSRAIRQIRGKDIAMIFQEPMTSLSPVHTIGSQIAESIRLHTSLNKSDTKKHAVEMMQRVGIPDPGRRFKMYPHEMSGGLRQRAMIAMALCCRPALLIADEPTTALDVTIQAQILDLMRDLQQEFNMSIMLITHDLGVVAEMADQVAVMYRGRVVEQSNTHRIFENPQHPYTQALMQSIPGITAERKTRLRVIAGSVPDPLADVPGCSFHLRCQHYKVGLCDVGDPPPLRETSPGHANACLVRQEEKTDG